MKRGQTAFSSHWSLGLSLMLAVVCVCGAGLAVGGERAAVGAGAPAGPTPVPWLPSESYPDGPRSDPRLDSAVQFWRAGLSLKEVFAGIGEQTGVEIGFWPLGDENERVRVNIYLGPDQPPALRDLMSQLSWVTACAFGYEPGAGNDEPCRYYLLSTSAAGAAQARLDQEWAEAMGALRGEWESRAPESGEVTDRLDAYRRALLLTTDELIDLYYGVDDRLLANMFDPARRASVSFALSLGDESLDSLLDGERLTLEWQDLTTGQQAELRSCLMAPRRRGRGGRWGPAAAGADEGDWGDREVTQVHVGGLSYGQVMLIAEAEPSGAEPRGRRGRFLWAPMLDLTGEGELRPDEAVALRRGLGEDVTDEEARSLFGEWAQSQRDEMRQRWEERTREAAEAAIADGPPVSPDVEAALSSFVLPVAEDTPYALWQIQEAVASVTGMHVVSDCFSQPRRDLSRALRFLHPGEEVEMTGLQALRVSCLTTEDASSLAWAIPGDHRAGWEWQDAGSFLRFRSKGRDLWRASMLPSAAMERLDRWLYPYVAASGEMEAREPAVDVALDLQQISLMAAGLSDLQIEHGGKLICGDPTERSPAYRQALREEVLRAMSRGAPTLRALAMLSDPQWEQLRGPGLRVEYDLTGEQKDALGLSAQQGEGEEEATGAWLGRGGRGRGRPGRGGLMFGRGGRGRPGGRGMRPPDEQELGRLVIRLSEERPWEQDEQPGPRRGRDGDRRWRGRWLAKESHYLGFWLDGEVRFAYPIPRVVSVPMTLPTTLGRPVSLETR